MSSDNGKNQIVLCLDCKKPIDQEWAEKVRRRHNKPNLRIRRCAKCFLKAFDLLFLYADLAKRRDDSIEYFNPDYE